jgi:dienelactone hydrolase
MSRLLITLNAAFLILLSTPVCSDNAAPFAVGSMTRFFHDESRGFDAVAGVNSGVRVLLTEIWYPVNHLDIGSDSKHPTHGDYVFGDMEMHRRMMTQMVTPPLNSKNVREGITQSQIDQSITALFHVPRASYIEVPLARSKHPFPVVVMSHGDGGTRYNMETVAEHLAAHGYLVIAPEHAGNASFAMTGRDPALTNDPLFEKSMQEVLALHDEHGAYGELANSGQSTPRDESGELSAEFLKQLDLALLQRVNDLRAILDSLSVLNNEGFFKDSINLEQIGLMGRSLGGATTLAALGLEPRFKSGVAVVAPSVPDFRSKLPKEMMASPDEESIMFSSQPIFPLNQLARPTFLLNSAEDALILNINMGLAMTFESELPAKGNPHPILRDSFQSSEAPVVWGQFENGNHGTLSVSGSYWWPELRLGQFPRYFDPAIQYTLTPARQAHKIQAEKIRLFFELTVRGDRTAQKKLLDNPWKDMGFQLEARNLGKAGKP